MKNNRTIILLIVLFTLATLYPLAGNELKNPEKKIIVQLPWEHNPQFCGLYVALEKGFFDDENLSVEISDLQDVNMDPITEVVNANADIALATGDQLLIHGDRGEAVKAFGSFYSRSLVCYLYKTDESYESGLNIFTDKKIAVYKNLNTEHVLLTLINKHNLDIDSNNIIQAPYNGIEAFINDEFDVLASYMTNEPILLKLAGIDVDYFDPAEYGVDFYSGVFVTRSDIWEDMDNSGLNTEDLSGFIKAVNRGWRYCKNNPDESISLMYSKYPDINEKYSRKMAEKSIEFYSRYITEDNNPAAMDRDKWLTMENDLFEIDKISQRGLVDKLCDFKFIESCK